MQKRFLHFQWEEISCQSWKSLGATLRVMPTEPSWVQNRERMNHCLYPLSSVFLQLLRIVREAVSKRGRQGSQCKYLLWALSSLFWFWFPVRALFGFWISVQLTHTLDDILSHWAVTWDSSVPVEINAIVLYHILTQRDRLMISITFFLLFDLFVLGGAFSMRVWKTRSCFFQGTHRKKSNILLVL